MHREYHPADMHHLRAHAFEDGGGHAHHERPPVALPADGPDRPPDRRRRRVRVARVGVVAGTVGGLAGAGRGGRWGRAGSSTGRSRRWSTGRIGADIALAQACLAALVIGQPFVAAEVVFIALVGEVLEAVTFDRTQRAIHRLLDQTPRTARVRRDGSRGRDPGRVRSSSATS